MYQLAVQHSWWWWWEGGQSWETLYYVCHFTPHPFPRVHKNSTACTCASSSRGSDQVEKAEAVLSCTVRLLLAFSQIIKSKKKNCVCGNSGATLQVTELLEHVDKNIN